jgi:hypothetical protein
VSAPASAPPPAKPRRLWIAWVALYAAAAGLLAWDVALLRPERSEAKARLANAVAAARLDDASRAELREAFESLSHRTGWSEVAAALSYACFAGGAGVRFFARRAR